MPDKPFFKIYTLVRYKFEVDIDGKVVSGSVDQIGIFNDLLEYGEGNIFETVYLTFTTVPEVSIPLAISSGGSSDANINEAVIDALAKLGIAPSAAQLEILNNTTGSSGVEAHKTKPYDVVQLILST